MILLLKSVDYHLFDYGYTTLKWAYGFWNTEIIELLQKAGAKGTLPDIKNAPEGEQLTAYSFVEFPLFPRPTTHFVFIFIGA